MTAQAQPFISEEAYLAQERSSAVKHEYCTSGKPTLAFV
jgi:hypothetical protein